MSIPASLDLLERLETAGESEHRRAERIATMLKHLAPSFAMLTDMTGRAIGTEALGRHAEHYLAQRLSIDAVHNAVREIVVDWDKAYWPTPQYIANVAHRILRQAAHDNREATARERELEAVTRSRADREWEDRAQRAGEWFEAHPKIGKLLVAGVDADIGATVAKHPRWRIATSAEYRRAYRQGAIVSEVLRRMAIENTPTGRRELRELGERFPSLAVSPYETLEAEPDQSAAA